MIQWPQEIVDFVAAGGRVAGEGVTLTIHPEGAPFAPITWRFIVVLADDAGEVARATATAADIAALFAGATR